MLEEPDTKSYTITTKGVMRTKGGKWGKAYGLCIYPYKEGKIKPYQRKRILDESETLIGEVNHQLHHPIEYIDTELSDEELIQKWNELWKEWGWMRGVWIDEWLKEVGVYDNRFW